MRPGAALGAVALVACHGGDVSEAGARPDAGPAVYTPYASGTRLRAEVYDVDGVRVLHGWFDTRLQMECAFDRRGHAGMLHPCLPALADASPSFEDAACTRPVHVASSGKALPGYLVVAPQDWCAAQPQVFQMGAATGRANRREQGRTGAMWASAAAAFTSSARSPTPP